MSEILESEYAERNKVPILEVLRGALPATGRVLEIASGTGAHIEFFAQSLPQLHWLPSDPDPKSRASIAARITRAGLPNVEPPADIDVLAIWPGIFVDAVIVANLLHISPPETLAALCEGAAHCMPPGGVLHIYGPFKRSGAHTSPGNTAFDESLRARNPAWGIRDLESVVSVAAGCGFRNQAIVNMPANNFSLVFVLDEPA
ncbi:MAG: DUF938 domain-containing protein [Pseudomonadales bacterium]|nr:DUF938 domain-containing protein [Pseudomonadales bacterium]